MTGGEIQLRDQDGNFNSHAHVERDSLSVVRVAKNEVHIDVESEGADIYYTTDGTEPTAQSAKYEVPFTLDKKGTVKAITYDAQSGKSGPVASRRFDLPAADYKEIGRAHV